MNRDSTSFLTSILVIAGVVALAIAWNWWKNRSKTDTTAADEQLRRERIQAEEKAIKLGTSVRLRDGAVVPKCRVETCTEPATRRRLSFQRSEGFGDYIRRLFGAKPRNQTAEDTWGEQEWCQAHQPLASALMDLRLAAIEQKRLTVLVDSEVEMANFERKAIYKTLDEMVANQEKKTGTETTARAAVIPLERSNGGARPS